MFRIAKISVKNFKSLWDFEIVFPENTALTALIGLNGAGKSTVLQLLDFIGVLFNGNIAEWLQQRSWNPTDLITKLHSSSRKQLIDITVAGKWQSRSFEWQGSYNPIASMMRCTTEKLFVAGEAIAGVKDGKFYSNGSDESSILLNYHGSIFSALNDKKLQSSEAALSGLISCLSSIRSFDLLSPRHIRNRSRKSQSMGMSGERLAGFMAALSLDAKKDIDNLLNKFYPFIHHYGIKTYRGGWNELRMWENIGKYDTPEGEKSFILARQAQHTNDGTLRLLSIISSLYSLDKFLLFDEIENGFNPSIIKKIVDLLSGTEKQVLVTTHSPEILQYIPDETARQAVKFIYKDAHGATLAADFFSDEEANNKLRALSPGEVFLDIDLDALAKRMKNGTANKATQ